MCYFYGMEEFDNITPIPLVELVRRASQLVNAEPTLRDQWITADLINCTPRGGHLHLELAQNDTAGALAAKVSAHLWRGTAYGIAARRTNQAIRDVLMVKGHEVMLRGDLTYDPRYGVGFNITDFNPNYRKDSAQIQAEILAKLKTEGILEKNKSVPIPTVAQRIAVISSGTAAGYGDFCNQLSSNPYNLQFYPVLFDATMQGVNTSPTIRAALERIRAHADMFDCVVIIRGGGAVSDLAGFDELELARAVATFPLPVIVGIGHERDNTVLDFIAAVRCKTPTAVAEWLIARGTDTLARIQELSKSIASYVGAVVSGERRHLSDLDTNIPILARRALSDAKTKIGHIGDRLPSLVRERLDAQRTVLTRLLSSVQTGAQARIAHQQARLELVPGVIRRATEVLISRQRERLSHLQETTALLSPQNVLARGYSITRVDGRALRSATDAPAGTELKTQLATGEITSTVNS